MKYIHFIAVLVCSPSLLAQQTQEIEVTGESSANVTWDSVSGRSYFLQWSTDLSNWNYFPLIEYGDGTPQFSYGFSSNSDKIFSRLHYTDQPFTGDVKGADFDLDGISNWNEIRLGGSGTLPFIFSTAGNGAGDYDNDNDGNGLPDGWELDHSSNIGSLVPNADDDNDGLTNSEEAQLGTGPNNEDSDGDSLLDGEDAAPLNTVISWKRSPEYQYAVVDLGVPTGVDLSDPWLVRIAENGNVLLSREEDIVGWPTGPRSKDDYKTYIWDFDTAQWKKLEQPDNLRGRATVINASGTSVYGLGYGALGEDQKGPGVKVATLKWGEIDGVWQAASVEYATGIAESFSSDTTTWTEPGYIVEDAHPILFGDNGRLVLEDGYIPLPPSLPTKIHRVGGTEPDVILSITPPEYSYLPTVQVTGWRAAGDPSGWHTAAWMETLETSIEKKVFSKLEDDGSLTDFSTPPGDAGKKVSSIGSISSECLLNNQGDLVVWQSQGAGTFVGKRTNNQGDLQWSEYVEEDSALRLQGKVNKLGVSLVDSNHIWRNGKRLPLLDVISDESYTNVSARDMSHNGMIACIADKNTQETITVLIPVDAAVDVNRDGEVRFDGSDKASEDIPFRFWINSDYDIAEDVEEVDSQNKDTNNASLVTTRGLEDLTRLWLNFPGLHEQLKNGELEVSLSFEPNSVEGNPGIRLYYHDQRVSAGGLEYLRDESAAQSQIAGIGATPIGLIVKGGFLKLPKRVWEGFENQYSAITDENTNRYFLMEGYGEGKGNITVRINKKSGELLGKTNTSCHLHLMDVREMYQRAKITSDFSGDFVTEPSDFVGVYGNPTITPPVPNVTWVWDPNGKNFIEDPRENKEYLVFIHGWRMTYSGSQKYGETMFKRLWQTGYKGRYAFVRWPTYSADTNGWTSGLFTYNPSDYRAWISGKGLAKFVNALPADYVRNVTAHSMGNIVAGSALREGMQVDNYALLNAAVPAMCYDGNEVLYEFSRETPDGDADPITKALGFKEKITDDNVSGNMINFYLSDDEALTGLINLSGIGEVGGWEDNNRRFKPETFHLGTTGYSYNPESEAGKKVLVSFPTEFARRLRYFHESAAYATASRTKPVGADGRTNGAITDKIDMDARYEFGGTHSAEWLWRIQKTHIFYHDLMEELDLQPISQP